MRLCLLPGSPSSGWRSAATSSPAAPSTSPRAPRLCRRTCARSLPASLFYNTRLWESLAGQVQAKTAGRQFRQEDCLRLAHAGGPEDARMRSTRSASPGLHWRVLNALADLIVYRPIRDSLGLPRARVCYYLGLYAGTRSSSLLPRSQGASEEHLRLRRGGGCHRGGRARSRLRARWAGQPGRRGQVHRGGRDRGPEPGGVPRVLQRPRDDGPGAGRRLGPHRRQGPA